MYIPVCTPYFIPDKLIYRFCQKKNNKNIVLPQIHDAMFISIPL